MEKRIVHFCFFILVIFLPAQIFYAQNNVSMEVFNFYVPVDIEHRNGTWWDNLTGKAQNLKEAGITAIWTPPPGKGLLGIEDVGYSIFDHFDLGNYDQRGTKETRYGSQSELENMVHAMHERGIEVYSDTILHHLVSDNKTLEPNPIVKSYVAGEANNGLHTAYPTNQIVWRVPNAAPGDYYFQVKGYNLPCSANSSERAYELYATWTNSDPGNPFEPNYPQTKLVNTESEPNNGNGQFNNFVRSGGRVWAQINQCGDVDEYKIKLAKQADINLVLTSLQNSKQGKSGDQTRGYRISRVSNSQGDITDSLQALTYTHIDYQKNYNVTHTGTGEQNWVWDYTYFHPNSPTDYLETYDGKDGVIPRAKLFGNDIDTSDLRPDGAVNRLIYWGKWLTNQIGYDGYRLDSANLFEEDFGAAWIKAMPKKADGSQRLVVTEFVSLNNSRIRSYVEAMESRGVDVKVYDYNLKETFNDLANKIGTIFNMTALNHAGFVQDNQGGFLPGTKIITFAENENSARPGHWLTKDWQLPYAYLLFSEGNPFILYAHFYGTKLYSDGEELTTPISLQQDLRKLINIRRQQLEGSTIVLSEIGNPTPSTDTANVYIARRSGDLSKNRPGAILVLNNNDSATKCLTVDNAPSNSNVENWANKILVDLSGKQSAAQVASNGRVEVCAAPRGYSIYVPVEWMNNRSSDFNRDGIADLTVWRPSNGVWSSLQNSGAVNRQWGIEGDQPVAADYDGDRKTDFAVFRPSTGVWHILKSSDSSEIHYPFGTDGDIPIPEDYDGDGKIDLAVYRPSNGNWYIKNSADNSDKSLNWGIIGDLPIAADFDGDGRADIAVWRPSNGTWYILNSGVSGSTSTQFGMQGDKPVPADYDGDRRTDLAVYRLSNGTWYILNSKSGAFNAVNFGTSEDIPTPADFDGDGKTDIALWRPSNGTWYGLKSSNSSFFTAQFGQKNDVPIK